MNRTVSSTSLGSTGAPESRASRFPVPLDRATVVILTRTLRIRALRYTCDDDLLAASLSRCLPFGFPDELSLNHPHLDLNTQLRFCRIPLQPRCRGRVLRHVRPIAHSIFYHNPLILWRRHGRNFEGNRLSIQVCHSPRSINYRV